MMGMMPRLGRWQPRSDGVAGRRQGGRGTDDDRWGLECRLCDGNNGAIGDSEARQKMMARLGRHGRQRAGSGWHKCDEDDGEVEEPHGWRCGGGWCSQ
jgi:hypothetical protein